MTEPERTGPLSTSAGPIVGHRELDVNVFRGVPYAAAPIGPLRFRAPQSLRPWAEPFEASEFGFSPLQPVQPQLGPVGPMSEDCLHLNIWAPRSPGPHPVLFWVYGGANMFGSASQAMYDGAKYAERGVVFVSANYRLGVFGYLELGPVLPVYAGSSLNGLRDLVAALDWVRDNIAAFGGDPGAVTLMGESAGAKNICALATIPRARGLFNRVAIQSGGGHSVFSSPEAASPVSLAFLEAAQVSPDDARRLTSMPASALIEAQQKLVASYPQSFPLRPAVDGDFLPARPIDAARAGVTSELDMIIGTCRDEAALFLPTEAAARPFEAKQITDITLAEMQTMEAPYAQAFPDLPVPERRIRQLTAAQYWLPSIRFLEAHVVSGGRSRMYRFDHRAGGGPLPAYAFHGSDLPYIFDAPWSEMSLELKGKDADFAVRTIDMWAGWARDGSAHLEGSSKWPAYDLKERQTLLIDDEPTITKDPQAAERELWSHVFPGIPQVAS